MVQALIFDVDGLILDTLARVDVVALRSLIGPAAD